VVVATVCSQFFTPARTVLIRDIVSEEDRARAAGLAQTTQSLAIILGPAIAAILISRVGVQPALLFDALTFVVSFAAILSVRSREGRRDEPARESPDFAQELREGIRFCLGNRVLRALLIAMVVTMLGGGALNALDAFFVTQNLHAPAPMLGTINAAYGLGAVFGAVLAAVFARRIQLPLVFCLSVTGFGVAFLVYARMTSLIPAAMLLFLAGFPQAGLSVALGPLVMHLTPRDMLGRISGIFGPMISLATMVSAGIAGLLVSTILRHFHAGILGLHFGPIDTVFTASGALMLAAGLYAMVGLRGVRVDRQGMRDRSPRGVAPPAETPRHEAGPALSDTRS
jgi:MFS family permease